MNLNKENLLKKLEDNIRGRFSYFQKHLNTMAVIEEDFLLIANSREMTDMFNIVCCSGPVDKARVFQVIKNFRDNNLPFAWWVGFEGEPSDLTTMLEELGLQRSEEELAMTMELNAPVDCKMPENLVIKRVDNSQEMKAYTSVITKLVPDERIGIESFYHQAEKIAYSNPQKIEFYVGYIDSHPVTTCLIFFSETVAGIFDIIASPEVRGMGIGTAMTLTAV